MIVHIMILDKFIPPFIDFIEENFDEKDHIFILFSVKENKYGLKESSRIVWVYPDRNLIFFMRWLKFAQKLIFVNFLLYKSKKIIFHGLWDFYSIFLMLLQPWLFKKCYWVMWGGDFYFPEEQPWWRRASIRKIKHFVTYIPGDFKYLRVYYKIRENTYYECLMYLSNVYNVIETESNVYNDNDYKGEEIYLLVGNSATETNNHFFIFDKLLSFRDACIKIYVPLSYGDMGYAQKVIQKGKDLFGEKFVPITKFLTFEEYIEFLKEIDIAIFAHNRQQAMGNIITLLGMGKKVYMNKYSTSFQFFSGIGVKVFDVNALNIEKLDFKEANNNSKIIKKYFSYDKLYRQWEVILND
ncbi:MAG: TDP-N-acetylfucosamine:lipid II N-acetylfucosaminyltransferase [Brevinematales bacterium]